MTSNEFKEAYVFAPDPAGKPILAGVMKITGLGGEFTYSDGWLEQAWAYPLDPQNLPLMPSRHVTKNKGLVFGVFSDSAPDSWGERIMLLNHKSVPKNEIERLVRLSALGTGVGGLRFSLSRAAVKASADLPDIGLLQQLADIANNIDLKLKISDDELRLLEPGSSMGGARPKVSLQQANGTRLIAKFSKESDLISYPVVEHASMSLLAKAGIRTPKTSVFQLAHQKAAYLIDRFDHVSGRGIHFISANSLFNVDRLRTYEHGAQDPAGYIALSRVLRKFAADPEGECEELFSRMAANILIGNTDDHAWNHGLIFDVRSATWQLSPVYDVLPIMGSSGQQSLSVGEHGRESSIANAMSAAKFFGIREDKAEDIIKNLISVFSDWEEHFVECGVSDLDIQLVDAIVSENLKSAKAFFGLTSGLSMS